MSLAAPLRIPVELRRLDQRWFGLAVEVSQEGLGIFSQLPEELDGPLELSFHLPGDPQPIRCHARAEEVVVAAEAEEGERAERRALRFLDLEAAGRLRIDRYVQERVGAV